MTLAPEGMTRFTAIGCSVISQAFQLDTINHQITLRQRNDLLIDLDEADLPQDQTGPISQLIMSNRKVVGAAGIENGRKDW